MAKRVCVALGSSVSQGSVKVRSSRSSPFSITSGKARSRVSRRRQRGQQRRQRERKGGAVPNVQVHVRAPSALSTPSPQPSVLLASSAHSIGTTESIRDGEVRMKCCWAHTSASGASTTPGPYMPSSSQLHCTSGIHEACSFLLWLQVASVRPQGLEHHQV